MLPKYLIFSIVLLIGGVLFHVATVTDLKEQVVQAESKAETKFKGESWGKLENENYTVEHDEHDFLVLSDRRTPFPRLMCLFSDFKVIDLEKYRKLNDPLFRIVNIQGNIVQLDILHKSFDYAQLYIELKKVFRTGIVEPIKMTTTGDNSANIISAGDVNLSY